MARRRRLLVLALIVAAFVAVSAGLARVFSAAGAERDEVTALIQSEARGDVAAMLDDMPGCRADARCRSQVAADSRALKQPGPVSILQFTPTTAFPVLGGSGTARVAWQYRSSRPVTQCVRIRRSGNPVAGLTVRLTAITRGLAGNANCPASFY
jgi:hypothetical protein